MSITRWGCDGSDVYVFHHVELGLVCMACTLTPDEQEYFIAGEDGAAMLAHLNTHREHGDSVPEHAFERIRREYME